MRPVGIDLFAGAGGMSLGFEQAGFDVVTAVEIDPIHAATHEYNFPRCKVLARSVQDLTGRTIRDAANLSDRKVDVVFGGAPCQGFSMIGRRALDDPRNSLVRDFVRLVVELDADHFVFENVKGITVGRHVSFLSELIAEFAKNGYETASPWRVLNAAHHGVPQDRERLFLMGSKTGLMLPTYPAPSFSKPGSRAKSHDLPIGPTCRDALDDVPDAESFDELVRRDQAKVRWGKPSAYAAVLRGIEADPTDFGHPRKWDAAQLTSSLRSAHTEISRRRFAATAPGTVEPISRFFRLPPEGVSNTLRAGTDAARGAFTSPRPIHYKYPRCVTVREMARLHGFPDWFRFHVTKWHGARQIGNAVPPPLAKAVAERVIAAIGCKPVRASPISLGSAELLEMDMAQASAHFDISAPIGRRDRKTGTKRRQWDDLAACAAE